MRRSFNQVFSWGGQTCHILPSLTVSRSICWKHWLQAPSASVRCDLMAGNLLIPTTRICVVTHGCGNSFSASLVLSSHVLRSQLFCCLCLVKLNLDLLGILGNVLSTPFNVDLSVALQFYGVLLPSAHCIPEMYEILQWTYPGARSNFPFSKRFSVFVFEFLEKCSLNNPL